MTTAWTFDNRTISKITKELAHEFSTMESAPGERRLDSKRLKALKEQVVEGRFRPPTWAKAYCEETSSYIRVNGNHTSHVYDSLDTFPENEAYVETYICPTLLDVADLWRTFDSPASRRTKSDYLRAYSNAMDDIKSLPNYVLTKGINAISAFRAGMNASDQKSKKTSNYIEENFIQEDGVRQFLLWLKDLLGDLGDRHYLCRKDIMAAMYATWSKNPKEAEIFWTFIRDNKGTDASPQGVLRAYLRTTNSPRTNSPKYAHTSADNEMYSKCILAWNAFRYNVTDPSLHWDGVDIPEAE